MHTTTVSPVMDADRPRAGAGSTIIVTIDGPGGVGKSTAAKLLAKALGIMYLDTGATYRALAYAALQQTINPVADAEGLTTLARTLDLRLEPLPEGGLRVLLGGKDISQEIRTERISEVAAHVSQHPSVREAMVELQRRLAREQSVVVEGRDTGSVVFPKATHKFFLDAEPRIRAERRQRELGKVYGMAPPLAEVEERLQLRDGLDRTRRMGPLVQPSGATMIDTSHRTIDEVVEVMVRHVHAGGEPRSS